MTDDIVLRVAAVETAIADHETRLAKIESFSATPVTAAPGGLTAEQAAHAAYVLDKYFANEKPPA